ncbi:MAG: hypothetical protein GY701_18980, partial [Sulfitobacter sp.]|nr:hypothetical protein [Sulfitobacter sp.]
MNGMVWRMQYGRGRRLGMLDESDFSGDNDNEMRMRIIVEKERPSLDEFVFVDLMNGMSE